MSNPKISIIIPVYNVEKYLKRCIDSILNQTLKDIEIIIVDDESPDNCPHLCDMYARIDQRIKVIHKKNEGLGLARNSGIEMATGEYVAFVDSDDFVDNRMYEKLYTLSKECDLDTIYCGCYMYYNDKRIHKRQEVKGFTLFKGRKEVDKFLLDYIGPLPYFPRDVKYMKSVWKALYSRKIIKENNLKFNSEKIIASEDILFHIDYLKHANAIGFIPEHYYYYCYNESSISKTVSEAKIEKIKLLLNEVNKKLEEYFNQEQYKIHLYRLMLLDLRAILNIAIKLKKNTFKKILNGIYENELFKELFNEYPFHKMPTKHRILYSIIKSKNTFVIRTIFKLLNQ